MQIDDPQGIADFVGDACRESTQERKMLGPSGHLFETAALRLRLFALSHLRGARPQGPSANSAVRASTRCLKLGMRLL